MTIRSVPLMKCTIVMGLCTVLCGPAAVAGAVAAGPRARIEVSQTQKDAGVFEEGAVIPFHFEVVNRGEADLEISQVKPTCGCTVAKWDRVIKPGEQGTIDAQMSTLSFRGVVTKHMTIFSNDPDRPQVELTLTAHLTPLVNISPEPDALLVVGDKGATQEFTLERSKGLPMRIVQVICYAPYLKAEATPLSGPGRYKLTVTAMPDAPLGSSKAAVVVWTDLKEGGALTFFLTVERGIATVPPMLFLGIVPHEMRAPLQATATIHGNSTPFHVKSVSATDPKLAPRLETVRDGAEYRVTVTYAGGWSPGRRRQTLTLTTDDPKQPVIEIPVEAIVQSQLAKAPLAATH